MGNNNINACLNIKVQHFNWSWVFSGSKTEWRRSEMSDVLLQTPTITSEQDYIYKQIADAYRSTNLSFLSWHAWSSILSLQERERLGHSRLCMLSVNYTWTCVTFHRWFLCVWMKRRHKDIQIYFLILTLCPRSPGSPGGPLGALKILHETVKNQKHPYKICLHGLSKYCYLRCSQRSSTKGKIEETTLIS